MKITQLLTPVHDVAWLSAGDTVRDAFDRLGTHNAVAAPLLDWTGRYLGAITEADLRRHVAGAPDRVAAFATPLATLERRARCEPVTADRDLDAARAHARGLPFLPVVDAAGRLLGVIERARLDATPVPSAA